MAEGSVSLHAGEIEIHGQLSHLNSACGNLSSYNLKHKVRGQPCRRTLHIHLLHNADVTLLRRFSDCGSTFGELRQQAAGVG